MPTRELAHRILLASEEGRIKRLHVDKHVITANRKYGTDYPPITVQTSAGPLKATRVYVDGPSEFIYDNENPLSCGARLWIETKAPLTGDWVHVG